MTGRAAAVALELSFSPALLLSEEAVPKDAAAKRSAVRPISFAIERPIVLVLKAEPPLFAPIPILLPIHIINNLYQGKRPETFRVAVARSIESTLDLSRPAPKKIQVGRALKAISRELMPMEAYFRYANQSFQEALEKITKKAFSKNYINL
jgi:hypothetical protein